MKNYIKHSLILGSMLYTAHMYAVTDKNIKAFNEITKVGRVTVRAERQVKQLNALAARILFVAIDRASDLLGDKYVVEAQPIKNTLGRIITAAPDLGKIDSALFAATSDFNSKKASDDISFIGTLVVGGRITQQEPLEPEAFKRLVRKATTSIREGGNEAVLMSYLSAEFDLLQPNYDIVMRALEKLKKPTSLPKQISLETIFSIYQ